MSKSTRFAIIDNEKPTWIAFASRREALRAIESGRNEPGTAKPVVFTGEILTERQMIKRGLLK